MMACRPVFMSRGQRSGVPSQSLRTAESPNGVLTQSPVMYSPTGSIEISPELHTLLRKESVLAVATFRQRRLRERPDALKYMDPKALQIWVNRAQARVFRAFHACAIRRKHLRALLFNAAQHARHPKLSRGWCTWRSFFVERQRSMALLRRAAQHARHPKLSRGWRTWRSFFVERQRSMASLRRAAQHARHPTLSRGWRTWRSFFVERHRSMAFLRRAAQHARQPRLSRGWGTWRSFFIERHRSMAFLRRAAQHARQPRLSRMWHTWLAMRSRARRDAFVARRALRLAAAPLARAWNTWQDRALETAVHRRRTAVRRTAVSRLHGKCHILIRALLLWSIFAQSRVSTLTRMRYGASRFLHRRIAPAFVTWTYKAAARVRTRMLLRKGLRWFTHRQLAQALGSWTYMAMEAMLMRKALQRLSRRQLTRALGSWSRAAKLMQAAVKGRAEAEAQAATDAYRLCIDRMGRTSLLAIWAACMQAGRITFTWLRRITWASLEGAVNRCAVATLRLTTSVGFWVALLVLALLASIPTLEDLARSFLTHPPSPPPLPPPPPPSFHPPDGTHSELREYGEYALAAVLSLGALSLVVWLCVKAQTVHEEWEQPDSKAIYAAPPSSPWCHFRPRCTEFRSDPVLPLISTALPGAASHSSSADSMPTPRLPSPLSRPPLYSPVALAGPHTLHTPVPAPVPVPPGQQPVQHARPITDGTMREIRRGDYFSPRRAQACTCAGDAGYRRYRTTTPIAARPSSADRLTYLL